MAFLVGLREKFKVPHEACNFVAGEVKSLMESSALQLKTRLQSALQDADDLATVDLNHAFCNNSWENALDYYSDARHVNSFCAESLNFVQPVEYVLGKAVNGKDQSMQYVSIFDTLKSLLLIDEVFAEVVHGHASQTDAVLDFCDGVHCKNNNLLSVPHNLQIQLYNDDFCVANPLGNKVKTLKFSAFYFILGNIAPKFRSKLKMIQLVCLCPSEYVNQYGMRQVLQPLIHDLHVLETEGIATEKDNVQHTFKGTLSMIVADNLGAHSVGGVQESFNTRRVCRFCHVTKQDIKNHLRASAELR